MEHSGDIVGALKRHTSAAAERYGALTAQAPAVDSDPPSEATAGAPHPLDAEVDGDE